ncbi:MAG: dephospho-CoA kinase, partial [Flavobacteriales bacterium]|nr:dephospho-CoA kinase [Flavobacteriales bacterium]
MDLTETFELSREASRQIALLDAKNINSLLCKTADAAVAAADYILAENKKDLARMDPASPMYDRLMLTRERIDDIASDIRHVAELPTPVGELISSVIRPNGMRIDKVRVPFGVVGVIYDQTALVAQRVFADKSLLAQLNAIVHPAVKADILRWVHTINHSTPCFVECAILYQAGFDALCDIVVVVTAPEEIRIERVIARDYSSIDKVRARMRAQNTEQDILRAD